MRSILVTLFIFNLSYVAFGQATFKCGWNTYKTAFIQHEYTYNCLLKDSIKLFWQDSTVTFITADSLLAFTVDYSSQEKSLYKSARFFNPKKQLIKEEEYKDNDLQSIVEYKYDEKRRKIYQLDDNRVTKTTYKKTFEYLSDKKTNDSIIQEVAYANGRVEFYTKTYFNKQGLKYKEVRLNDNNKDIVHVENFFYNAAGKLKERTVFFPEFNVTKKFPENINDNPEKCSRSLPINVADKFTPASKVGFAKKVLNRNLSLLYDVACHDYAYRFHNKDCEVKIVTTKINNVKQVTVAYKEKI